MAGLNSILSIFLPKDRVFFQLFENVAEELVKMGENPILTNEHSIFRKLRIWNM